MSSREYWWVDDDTSIDYNAKLQAGIYRKTEHQKEISSNIIKVKYNYFSSEFSNKGILSLRKRIIRVIKSMIRKKSKRVEYA